MRVWVAILRVIGTLIVLLTINEAILTVVQLQSVFDTWVSFTFFLTPLLEHMAIAALCFAGASALGTLRRIDERISRRRVYPTDKEKSVAPDAPAWGELPPPLHRSNPITESVDAFEERLLRKRLRRFERD
jgi:hypothetical protein